MFGHGDGLGTLDLGLLDGSGHLGTRRRRHQRADGRRRVLAVAHLQGGDRNSQSVDQFVMDVAHGDDPSGSGALLSGGPHGTTDHRGYRHVEIGVGKHDARVVSAEF